MSRLDSQADIFRKGATTSQMNQQVLFSSSQNSKYDSDFYLRGDPVSLIITNIPSFKGGRANPWMDADNVKIGLNTKQGEAIKPDEFENVF